MIPPNVPVPHQPIQISPTWTTVLVLGASLLVFGFGYWVGHMDGARSASQAAAASAIGSLNPVTKPASTVEVPSDLSVVNTWPSDQIMKLITNLHCLDMTDYWWAHGNAGPQQLAKLHDACDVGSHLG